MIENFILFPVLRNKEVIRSFLLFNFSFLDIYLKFNFILINLSSHQREIKKNNKNYKKYNKIPIKEMINNNETIRLSHRYS